MPTPDEEWADMCEEFRRKQDAYTDCLKGLYRSGRIVSQERLEECERLRREARQYREQMDDWLKRH
jgi:hypothetical protein